jgi:hypothetical protein
VQPFLKLEQIHTFAFSLRVDIVSDAAETYSVLQPLIPFAHHCPLLQDLDVRITNSQLPDLSDWPIICYGLQRLRLEVADVHNPLHLPRLLDRIFLDLSGDERYHGYERSRWDDMLHVIQMFQAVRKDGRQVA